jgi:hypothetical protein
MKNLKPFHVYELKPALIKTLTLLTLHAILVTLSIEKCRVTRIACKSDMQTSSFGLKL